MDDDEINKEKPMVHISIKERQIRISQLLNSNKNDKRPTKTVEFNLLEEQKNSKCVSKFNMEKRQLSLKNTAIAEKLNNALFSKGNSCTDNTLISYDRKNINQSKELNLKNKDVGSLKTMDYSLLNKKISENYKNQLSNVLLMKNNNPQTLHYKNAPKKKKDTDIFEKGISIEGVLINKKVDNSNEDNETEKKKHILKLFSKNSVHVNKHDTTMEKNNNSLQKEMKSYYKNKTFTDRFLHLKHESYNSEDINSETTSKNKTIVENTTTINRNKNKKKMFSYFKNICKRRKHKINSKQQLHSSQSNSTTSMQSLNKNENENKNKKHSKFFFFCVK
ncbi:conserved Plasmodium protein, unknown function [Plasmodium sp. gorilla clade G2]|uniref:conserved Plasmodium protein, unknown function n=1 Tax=Plasmodium sp. gorilla clade G2 TaxID=880535 RepID=UPI000D2246F1|nr:conserved Plasmodium protein, unknown function [Plasmodium sp. gorilla clade G2]SOV11406.1 conserved Plasmodium protein, unknown function [Plasmodium sp. gorilla clade G2]